MAQLDAVPRPVSDRAPLKFTEFVTTVQTSLLVISSMILLIMSFTWWARVPMPARGSAIGMGITYRHFFLGSLSWLIALFAACMVVMAFVLRDKEVHRLQAIVLGFASVGALITTMAAAIHVWHVAHVVGTRIWAGCHHVGGCSFTVKPSVSMLVAILAALTAFAVCVNIVVAAGRAGNLRSEKTVTAP